MSARARGKDGASAPSFVFPVHFGMRARGVPQSCMRRALLVGVNKYRLGCNLRGCLNDVRAMVEVLRLLGWSPREMRVLTDSRATTKAISEGLLWLVDKAKPGDVLFFYFSGHGSQVRDDSGDELSDGYDEIICPHDFDWDGKWISDDHMALLTSSLPPGVLMEQVFDCCHSGTLYRGVHLLPARPRFIPPPLDLEVRREPLPVYRFRDATEGPFWAACREDQTAAEVLHGLRFHGLFTVHLVSLLKKNPRLPREELFAALSASMARSRQSPVYQGPRDVSRRPFLG